MLLQSPRATGLALAVVMVYLQNIKKYCNGMLALMSLTEFDNRDLLATSTIKQWELLHEHLYRYNLVMDILCYQLHVLYVVAAVAALFTQGNTTV